MRLRKKTRLSWTLILAFFFVDAGACNSVAGIETGKLGSCPDGSRLDGTNCEDSGSSGAGGVTNNENNGSSSASSGSSGGMGASCETPWQRREAIDGRCYLQEFVPRVWAAAEQRCIDLGGHLIAIDSASELGLVGMWMGAEVWIGGTDAGNEGAFVWTNGQPWSFASWKDGVPVDPGGNRDCVTLVGAAGSLPVFDCRSCTDKRPYICESAPMNP